MKFLCKSIGGSTAYGLKTPTSDIDHRGVFINTNPTDILGLSRFDCVQKQETEDELYYEVRKFFELLRNGNTGALELLFTENFTEITPSFQLIYNNRSKFVDTNKMFSCLRGYMLGERKLANGERTGQLGGKRKAQLDRYGFSPKNFTQLFRLAKCGVVLFQTGEFPVNLAKLDVDFRDALLDIKVHPEKHTKEELNARVDAAEIELALAYENRRVNLTFNVELANELLRRMYLPYLVGNDAFANM